MRGNLQIAHPIFAVPRRGKRFTGLEPSDVTPEAAWEGWYGLCAACGRPISTTGQAVDDDCLNCGQPWHDPVPCSSIPRPADEGSRLCDDCRTNPPQREGRP
jgi:hypothetical protein